MALNTKNQSIIAQYTLYITHTVHKYFSISCQIMMLL